MLGRGERRSHGSGAPWSPGSPRHPRQGYAGTGHGPADAAQPFAVKPIVIVAPAAPAIANEPFAEPLVMR